MRKLLLMRHAKAVREPGLTDRARRLNERGREDAVRVARFLQRHGLTPDHAIASDSRRTRETLELAAAAFDPAPAIQLDASLYLAEPAAILKAIHAVPAATRTLLVVGHNPGIADLALALTERGDGADVRRLAASFPTAAIAVIDLDCAWPAVAEPGGRLERFILAKPLREAAGAGERDQ
ncbi:MAG: SixA phosphatase family protein [Beijerinckiaceae bacterium]